MLGSAVPPCRTITFDGGQFVEALGVPAVAAFPAASEDGAPDELEFEAAWPEAAGVLLQFDAVTLFLRRRLFVVDGFLPAGDVPAVAADGSWEVFDGVDCEAAP